MSFSLACGRGRRPMLVLYVVVVLVLVRGGPAGAEPTPAFSIIDLGTLGGQPPFGGAPFSNASAMNASGQVVGLSPSSSDSSLHAFFWSQGGGMVDLGTLGGNSSS